MDADFSRRRFLGVAGTLPVVILASCGKKSISGRKVAAGAAVLSDPGLRSDPIHANAQGYERFARSLLAAAKAAQLV